MKERDRKSRVEKLRKFLLEDQQVLQVILFGSYAKGTERAGSDIDVAIQLAKPMTPEQKLAYMERMQQCTGGIIDLVDL